MVYEFLADLVVVIHLVAIGFIAAGGPLVWRWPRLLWLHVPAVGWGVAIISIGFACPLTVLEKYLRRLGGEQVYRGAFIDHYLAGVVYPERLTWLVRALAVVATLTGYLACVVKLRRRRPQARKPRRAAAECGVLVTVLVTQPDGEVAEPIEQEDRRSVDLPTTRRLTITRRGPAGFLAAVGLRSTSTFMGRLCQVLGRVVPVRGWPYRSRSVPFG